MTAATAHPVPREAGFLDVDGRRLFVIRFSALKPDSALGPVVFVPPFGEEMNRARRMMTLQAEALARVGRSSIVFDYSCTGDSGGLFGEARYTDWVADLSAVIADVARNGSAVPSLLAIRFGALVAGSALSEISVPVDRLVLWQPVVSGATMLTQFLRVRLAADLEAGNGRETTKDLRARFDAGETIEIAGYEMSAGLAAAIDGAKLADLAPPTSVSVDWLEVVAADREPGDGDDALTPSSRSAIAAWQEAGATVRPASVVGEPFWAIQEITIAPSLIGKTTARLSARGGDV